MTSPHEDDSRPLKATLLVIGAAGIAVRLWFIFGLRFMEEDSLITLRYSKNLWENGSLVYNNGEQVMGFTSPLWTLLMSLLGGPFSFSVARTIITLTSLAIYAAGFFVTIRLLDRLGLPAPAQIFTALMLAFHASLIAESVSGMEMSLFYLLVITSAGLIEQDRKVGGFAVAALAVLTRPEGVIWWVALFAYCVLTDRRKLLRSSIPVSAAIYAPWLVFSIAYYGSFIPQSAMSKSAWLFGGSLVDGLWRPTDLYSISLLMSGSAVWSLPFVFQFLVLAVWLAFWGWGLWLAARNGRKLLLLFGGYAAAMVFFYYFGRGITFPWYAFVPNIFFVLVVSETVAHLYERASRFIARAPGNRQRLLRRTEAAVTALAVLAFLVVMGVRTASWIDVRDYEDQVLRATGEYLNRCSEPGATVMLEPLGYVGFFSERQVMDLAGLVSPEFAPSPEKFAPGWGAEQIQTFRPDWLILRRYEVGTNRFYASFDRDMFATDEQRQWFRANYAERSTFGEGDMGLVVMRREGVPTPCN